MGVNYFIYVGPYVEIKTNGLKRKVECEFEACVNTYCRKYKNTQRSKFCSECGTKVEMIKEEVEEDWDAFEVQEDLDIKDLTPDLTQGEGDTQLWVPTVDDLKGGWWDVRREEVWEDMSDLDVKEEITKVEIQCAGALNALEKVYGVKPVIKWGVLKNIN